MAPVFSLIVDEDVSSDVAMLYPELYKDLLKVTMIESHQVLCKLREETYH